MGWRVKRDLNDKESLREDVLTFNSIEIVQ